jgi:hypothetical protein
MNILHTKQGYSWAKQLVPVSSTKYHSRLPLPCVREQNERASTALRGVQISLRGLLSPSRRAVLPSCLASPRDVLTRRGFALSYALAPCT